MRNTSTTPLQVLSILVALLTLAPSATAEICTIEIDAPALLTVETASEITFRAMSSEAVILEESATHLVVAAARQGVISLETQASACDLQTSLTRTEVHDRTIFEPGMAPATATSFHPVTFATKVEDQDSLGDAEARPLLIMIHLPTIPTKVEDHEIDPDPDFQDHNCGRPTKVEDHDSLRRRPFGATYPDPYFQDPAANCGWDRAWKATSELVGQLGPGWYFVVRDGVVIQEMSIDSRI